MLRKLLFRFSEDISAGFPSAAEGYEDEPLNLHDWLVTNPAATFFYRVRGDDLCAEFIRNDSILVVDRSVKPKRGCLVLIENEGEFAVVRFQIRSAVCVLGVIIAVVTRL